MIDFYNGQITDLLPNYFSGKPEIEALGYAIREGTRLLYRYTEQAYLYSNFEQLPEKMLDLMAAELRTQYYEGDLDIETKRKLIKNTLSWYMKAGTCEAVQELIETVFGIGELEEWFEFGGEPYTFKVAVSEDMTAERLNEFYRLVKKIKNARSRLLGFDRINQIKQACYVGGMASITKEVTIRGFERTKQIKQACYVGGMVSLTKGITIREEAYV